MNALKLLIFFLALFSLNSYSQNKELIGKWTLFFTDEEVVTLDCKICPTWEFKTDNTSIFTKPNGVQYFMTWKIYEGNLLGFTTTDETQKSIEKGKLQMVFTKGKKFTELRFKAQNKPTTTMVLRKIND
jgi:hypothetical protein